MHGGADAVQIFFVISGFYMQFILGAGKYGTITDFYLSRWLRIFVPYVVAITAVIIASVSFGLVTGDYLTLSATLHPEGNGKLGTNLALLSNATIFLQDWIMFLRHEAGEPLRFSADFWADPHPLCRYLWIPPAWSVGVELTFYLLAPLLAGRLRTGMVMGLMALSLGARWFCATRLGLDHDPWTYRFFPFELFAFCLGMLACRLMTRHGAVFDRLTGECDRLAAGLGPWSLPLLAILVLIVARLHLLFAAVVRHALGGVVGAGSATQTVLAAAVSLTA
jgi:peptidoglycan/LPS O-acetylase OafA/YrhL